MRWRLYSNREYVNTDVALGRSIYYVGKVILLKKTHGNLTHCGDLLKELLSNEQNIITVASCQTTNYGGFTPTYYSLLGC